MSASIWFYIGIGCFVVAFGIAILAVVLFFRLNIRGVVRDLTGKSATMGIADIREETLRNQEHREKSVVREPGKSRGLSRRFEKNGDESETSLLDNGDERDTALLDAGSPNNMTESEYGDETTTVLLSEQEKKEQLSQEAGEESKTELLDDSENVTELLDSGDEGQTELLNSGDEGQTELLSSGDEGQTELLDSGDEGETTLLSNGDENDTTILKPKKKVDLVIKNTTIITHDRT